MHIVCAPDKFKQACSAEQAAQAMAQGARQAAPAADVRVVPLADGGDGTLDVLHDAFPDVRQVPANDPRRRPIPTVIAVSRDGSRALVESAQACGLWRLSEGERNPAVTDTYGVGQMIAAALDAGARKVLVGLGGSATSDGGAGMLSALGANFLDEAGDEISASGGGLKNLHRVDLSGLDPRLSRIEIAGLCDVMLPMLGPDAASRKFVVQKGGSARTMHKLEQNLALLAQCAANAGSSATGFEPGSGAAGGLGFGLLLLGGRLVPGAATVLESIGFEAALKGVDLVLTGEGSYDDQTADGKLVQALAQVCVRAGVPLVVLAGAAHPVKIEGVTAAFNINTHGTRRQDCLNDTLQNLRRYAEGVVRLMNRQ